MASRSEISSGSSGTPNADDITGAQPVSDESKGKRILGNQGVARRMRMRKQKRLDDLRLQLNQLRDLKDQLVFEINSVNQLRLSIETENSVLMAQTSELKDNL